MHHEHGGGDESPEVFVRALSPDEGARLKSISKKARYQSKRQRAILLAVLAGIAARMQQVGLRLHPDKTRIVYCKDSNRRASHEHTSFTVLGFCFRPRQARRKD